MRRTRPPGRPRAFRTGGAAPLCAVALLFGCGGRAARQVPRQVPGPAASALLAFAAESGTAPEDAARAWTAVEDIARRIDDRRAKSGATRDDPAAAVRAMNAVVFGDLGFARDVERDDVQVMALPAVLEQRRGNCVGLGALYLALAERLGVPLEGVLVPGHFFVRIPGPRPRNVELLRQGEAMPDAWYLGKYGPWGPAASAYLRGLTVFEVIAVHWFNAGNQWKREGDLPGAARAYARATKAFPAFAEAEASLGAVRHLQGDLPAAREAYRAAVRARPDLPGLAQNLSVLEAEKQAARGPSFDPHPRKSGSSPRRSWP